MEHGFIQFYERMESFYRQMTDRQSNDDRQLHSDSITMDNIWIYIIIFVAANCFNSVVFLGEIVIFHRETIRRAVRRAFRVFCNGVAARWRKFVINLRVYIQIVSYFARNAIVRVCRGFGVFSNGVAARWKRVVVNLRVFISMVIHLMRNALFRRN